MDLLNLLQSKPVLIGFHLGFAIVGIDAFLWLLGKLKDESGTQKSRMYSAIIGTVAFFLSWLFGGYYYVVYYGGLVKPIIKAGVAPWAHNIIMESKEHIFLFFIPIAVTILLITLLGPENMKRLDLRRHTLWLTGITAMLGLLIGAMGFIISAAARWGELN